MHAAWRRLTQIGGVCLALAACTSGEVDWDNYSPDVRSRIDRLASQGDCAGLQEEFDLADANDDAQRSRTGDGNADLMGYIDSKLDESGCYS